MAVPVVDCAPAVMGGVCFTVIVIKLARIIGRRFDAGEALNYPPPNFIDVNVVFTFHYLKCMASMY